MASTSLSSPGGTSCSFTISGLGSAFNTTNYIRVGVATSSVSGTSAPAGIVGSVSAPSSGSATSATGTASGLPYGTTTTLYGFAQAASGLYYAAGSASILTKPATPTAPTYSSGRTSTGGTFSWGSVTGATSYTLTWGSGSQSFATSSGSVTSMSPNTSYNIGVYATNASGNSPTSSTNAFTTLPGTPTSVSSSSIGQTTATISWTAPTNGATSYTVVWSGTTSGFTTVYGTSVTLNTLSPNGSYSIYVYATNGAGNGANSSTINFSTLQNPPGALDYTGTTATSTSISLAFSASGATSYTVNGVSSTSPKLFTGLDPTTTYSYSVVATNSGGSTSGTATKTTNAMPTPTFSIGTVTATSIQINVGSYSDAYTSCTVYREISYTGGASYVSYDSQTTTPGSSVTFTSTANTYYRFKVIVSYVASGSGLTFNSGTGLVVQNTPSVAVTGVSLNQTSASLYVGDGIALVATITPSNATNQGVSWSSSSPSVASVDSTGKVNALANGSTIITVTTSDGGKTATCSVTVTTPTINIPTNVSATSTSLSTLDASWTTPTGVAPTGYHVAVKQSSSSTWPSDSSTIANSISFNPLSDGIEYDFRIRAYKLVYNNNTGVSTFYYSSYVIVSNVPIYSIVEAPTGLVTSGTPTYNSITLTWAGVTWSGSGTKTYQIGYSATSGGPYTFSTTGITSTSASVSLPNPSTTYYFVVRTAIVYASSTRYSSNSSQASGTTAAAPPPDTPTSGPSLDTGYGDTASYVINGSTYTSAGRGDRSIYLTAASVSGATKYKFRATKAGYFNYIYSAETTTLNGVFIDTLDYGEVYIVSYQAGNSSGWSDWSPTTSATTSPAPPDIWLSSQSSTTINIRVNQQSTNWTLLNIFNTETSVTKTINATDADWIANFSGLTNGLTYNFIGRNYFLVNGVYLRSYYTDTLSVTIGRPALFQWTNTKTSSGSFNLTAAEWNSLTQNINMVREFKDLPAFSFTAAITGNNFTAAMYKQARSAINATGMNPSIAIPVDANAGDPVNASYLNGLRDSINSVT